MPARAPLDVDLEDKLLYGLTPTRLAYVVLSILAGFAVWSSPLSPQAARAVSCLAVIGVGAAMAWGRWRGRAADSWLLDMSTFVLRRHRVVWRPRWRPRFVRLQSIRRQAAPSGS
ncbi:MAG TPA: hypothetical protein VG426_13370 [Candidatus Dormibacteraeota bacterium]|nr:hypothetical protein [Candidatus Dormibacteraeota bacterium]